MESSVAMSKDKKGTQKWRCEFCQFDNLELIDRCEICESPRSKDRMRHDPSSKKKEQEAGIECPNSACKKFNPLTNDACAECGKQLFGSEGKQEKKVESKDNLVHCRHCDFANDPLNSQCVNCDRRLRVRIPRKTVRKARAVGGKGLFGGRARVDGYIQCRNGCGSQLPIIDHDTGEADECPICDVGLPNAPKSLCLFCDSPLKLQESVEHDKNCKERVQFFQGKGVTFERCSKIQIETIHFMHSSCERKHFKKQKALIDRIKGLGFSQKDLQNLHHYIIHYAPIIIHMHVNTHFHFFLKDTNYRNQFETNKSSGALSSQSRTNWEHRMFSSMMDQATPFERVKYGTMNFTNDPAGVTACSSYGQSYFLLKPHVRDRCTITDMDSSSSSATIGTFRFIYHVLMKLPDAELVSAFEGSKGKEMLSSVIGTYKEIQINGPVQFAKDIERVYISKAELKMGDPKALLEQVKTFCSKHDLQYELFDLQSARMSGHMGSVAPDRMVVEKPDLTQEDMKPPPAPAPAFGGGGGMFGGGAGLFAPSPFIAPPVPLFAPPPVMHVAPPRPPPKRKQYGVDYI